MPEKSKGENPAYIKRLLAAGAALMIAVGAAGCKTDNVRQPEPSAVVSSAEAGESAESLSNPQTEEESDEAESSESGESGEPTAETSQTSEPHESSESVPVDSGEAEYAESEETSDNAPSPPSTTAAATPEYSQTTTVTQTTAAEPAPKPTVVIPDVKTVSSPGTSVFSTDSGTIDYSNASLGYISAKYTGTRTSAKLRIICGGSTYDHDVTAGGVTEYFPLSCGSGSYTIQLYEQAEGNYYTVVIDETVNIKISDELSVFLYPSKYVEFSKSSTAVAKGAEVCAGADGTIDKLAAIFTWITDNISYDYDLAATVQSGYVPNPDSVIARGKGICFDYASLFAAMARSQGIPTRLVIGYASPNIYHAWNEVYTTETGWITPELLLSKKGYNLVDSTFYASAADKAKIAAYISENGNYSPIYYY